jgi:CRP-like cAMP-binding protein
MANDESSSENLTANHIFKSLPPEDLERLRPALTYTQVESGKVIFEPYEEIRHVYFPHGSMISVVAYTPNGQAAEVGVIGWEGMSGVDVVMGADSTPNQHVVQLPNGAWRADTKVIRAEFERGGAFQKAVLAFTRVMMLQISQTALCNGLHSVDRRLSRWLLMCRDRAAGDTLRLTQEFISVMLGVSRVAVSHSAKALQERGLIEYRHGRVVVLDAEGLRKLSCDCYSVVKKEYDAYLS